MGGSIGGMITAAYLSKYFKRITIIESDDVVSDTLLKSTPQDILDYRCRLESPTSLGRSGVSQIYQLHVLEGEGYNILIELFPHLKDKLLNTYGVRTYSLKTELRFEANGQLLNKNLTEDLFWLCIDRFTLEIVLRQELCIKFPDKIEWKSNSRVTNLIADRPMNIVKGVTYRCKHNVGSPSCDLYGDFIVDCTGRNSSSTKWLKEEFDLIVPTEQMHYGGGYVTFIGERFKTGDPIIDSMAIGGCTVNAPTRNTGIYVSPIRTIKTTGDNSSGILSTLGCHCVNSEFPPSDSYENLLEWAKDYLPSEYYTMLKSTKVIGPLVPYRRAINERKFVKSLGNKWPQNFILLGDTLCTFNPQYGQGMTHACRLARELNKIFNENYHQLKDISYIFNRRASPISEGCWLVSTANDWKTPTLKVIKTDQNGKVQVYQRDNDSTTNTNSTDSKMQTPLMIRFLQWYNFWFLQCASKSGRMSTDFLRVINQHSSPFSLLKPNNLLAVCHAAFMSYFH
ncbi:unnamed protein product [Rotaria magnacalcarata]|nr:unnamed protein product [Rotaria magnacalcarata]CAF1663609.1 unnamed protein product [Rotaria magnacalcarata]CAF2128153.1 unnamed protein product [Rotaria magnacalcarata]CAF4021309.1 unnamed protein product [Rotaria magnacalcarata]CAF4160475.1 unnamed protein product [Rotaria magnacalcarata]